MKLKEKIVIFTVIIAIIIAIFYAVRSVLTPFILSVVIAYFLNPLVDRFHRKYKMSRLRATALIMGLFFSTLISAGMLIFPVIFSQLLDFANSVPAYWKIFIADFYPKISDILIGFGFSPEANFSDLLSKSEFQEKAISFSKDLINGAINSTSVIFDLISIIFIMPILLFYFLCDWEKIIDKIDEYLPRSEEMALRKVFTEIDKTMSGYIRGQFHVCLMLGIIYAALLSCTGLNFGFLIGFATGMLVFIPYVGMLIGVTTAIIVALFQWGFDFGNIGLVSLVFLVGQVLESNILTPKLVGSRIGVHPLWLIFGLFFFGALFGFIGILLAVPLTAISGVIVKNLASEYKKHFV